MHIQSTRPLMDALDADREHIEQHTPLVMKAHEWAKSDRRRELLLGSCVFPNGFTL